MWNHTCTEDSTRTVCHGGWLSRCTRGWCICGNMEATVHSCTQRLMQYNTHVHNAMPSIQCVRQRLVLWTAHLKCHWSGTRPGAPLSGCCRTWQDSRCRSSAYDYYQLQKHEAWQSWNCYAHRRRRRTWELNCYNVMHLMLCVSLLLWSHEFVDTPLNTKLQVHPWEDECWPESKSRRNH